MPALSERYLLMAQNGYQGGQYVTGDSTDVTGGWFAIQAIEATTINGGTDCNVSNIAGLAIPAGDTIYGSFEVIKCSGKAVLYND